MRRRKLSKTRLRLGEKAGDVGPRKSKASIEEMFPEIPGEVDEILFDVSAEPPYVDKGPPRVIPISPPEKKSN